MLIRLRSPLFLDFFEKTAITLLYGWLLVRFYGELATQPANAIFLISEGIIVVLVLARRQTNQISIRPMDWIVGFCGTTIPMLAMPSSGGWIGGATLVLAGTLIAIGAQLSLRRSFGIVAANRGIKRTGLYAAVRHPMYLGYFVMYVGVLVVNPSLFNAVLLTLWAALQIIRIHAEERILMMDSTYRDHAAKVRYRLIPLVY